MHHATRFLSAAVIIALGCGQDSSEKTREVARSDTAANATSRERSPRFLDEALDNGFAKAMICGIGASSGVAAIMALTSTADHALKLEVREGTTLRSSDAGAQSMALHRVELKYDSDINDEIAHDCADAARMAAEHSAPDSWKPLESSVISIAPGATQLFVLSAYCIDFDKENPSGDTRFTLDGPRDPETAKLFAYLRRDTSSYDVKAIQLATWAVNGDWAPGRIQAHFPFDESDRTHACALLDAVGLNSRQRKLCVE
jgi:hypothetical protein